MRVSHAGHEDLVRDIDLVAGERASFYATLTPQPKRSGSGRIRPELLAFVGVTVVLIAVIGWIALRRSPETPEPRVCADAPIRADRSSAPCRTPVGPVTPGARRDE